MRKRGKGGERDEGGRGRVGGGARFGSSFGGSAMWCLAR